MALIAIKAFGGMVPAVDDRLLPDQNAALAQNSWVYDGKLTGMREPLLVHTLLDPNTRMAYRIPRHASRALDISDSYWIEFSDPDTKIVPGGVNSDVDPLYYWANGTAPPRYNSRSRIIAGTTDLVLGVPAPGTAPTVVPAGGVSVTTETRAYVYTHVSSFGEEGPPSDPSIVTTGKVDDTWAVTVTAVGGDATDRDLTLTRIYRTVTSDQGIATYFFVVELPIATLAYNDTITSAVVVLNEQLTSQEYDPPPLLLEGFTSMPNGMIIGWEENHIWFCEPFRPHAWPASYQLSTQYKIIGIGVYGQTAVIATEGVPYVCSGAHPSSMSIVRLTGLAEPCVSAGSVVAAPEGVYYASPAGLVLVGQNAQTVATAKLISKTRWQELTVLANISATMLQRAYFSYAGASIGAFEEPAFETTAFSEVDPNGSLNGLMIDMEDARVAVTTLLSTSPTINVFRDPWTNEVLLIRGGGVYQMDLSSDQAHGDYLWRSKVYQMKRPTNFGAAKIYYEDPDGVVSPATVLRVYAEGYLIHTATIPASGIMFRLPVGTQYDNYQFEFEGNQLITSAHFASTPKELKEV